MSSAQAAASAAFMAGKSSADKATQRQKPALRLDVDHRKLAASAVGSRRGLTRNTPSGAQKGPRKTPTADATAALCASMGLHSSSTPRFSSSNSGDSKRNSSEDQVSLGSQNWDYFSMPQYKSYSSQDLATPRARASGSTHPQEMIDLVKLSIKAKAKSGVAKEALRKNHAALSDFRQSIDNRIAISHLKSSNAVFATSLDDLKGYPSSIALVQSRSTSDQDFFQASCNRSHSSLGSAFSASLETNQATNQATIHTPGIVLTFHPDDEVSEKRPLNAAAPIQIPPSSNALARGKVNSLENMTTLSSLLQSPGSDEGSELIEGASKPGRKPPPSYGIEKQDRNGSSTSLESQKSGVETDMLETSEVKFPLFPEIKSKHHHARNIFSKKKKKIKGVLLDPLPTQEDESIVQAPQNDAAGVLHGTQHVKLKTTMRKTNRRKEKKTEFNEDKPWKNHSDLDVISEQQRKRYEGLWVSNKGLYMDRVITPLVGVSYENDADQKPSDDVHYWSEKEISERAAKLSTQVSLDINQTDIKTLHGLDHVKRQDLMHGAVVKRLWLRSKLPQETLSLIWDLVDCRKDGTLNKAEFLVGMWLVDQCLYGRKLPKVVGELVWASLGSLGVNVVLKKKRR